MKRLHTLDYLRGLAAFSILIYHFLSWEYGSFDATSVMGRIGLYGVSIFYILSGLTLYLVYQKRYNVIDFAVKRIFRIYPLLWLAIIGTLFIHGFDNDYRRLVYNLSGVFGFIDWGRYIATGAWSIGNELVFYALFPLLFYLLRKGMPLIVAAIGAVCFISFSFFILSPTEDLSKQWVNYVNPLNQVPYFIIGILMGHYFKDARVSREALYIILLMGILGLAFLPTDTTTASIITGWQRIFFTLMITYICFAFFKMGSKRPYMHRPLSFLGEVSYSVYLLHPIIWYGIGDRLHGMMKIAVCVLLTLLVSYFVFTYFEQYFIKVGKKISPVRKKEMEPAL